MALTALGIIAGLGSAGATAYAASQQGGGGGGGRTTSRVGSAPWATGAQSYLARLFALNATAQPASFTDYTTSGGRARMPLLGAGQFTPIEAQRLGLVGADNTPTPFFDPTQQNRFTNEQLLYNAADRIARRRAGKDLGPLQPAEQLYLTEQQIQRKERRLRKGELGARQGQRVALQLDKARKQRELLREQLFGAPGTPGPWQNDPFANPALSNQDENGANNSLTQGAMDFLYATGTPGNFGVY